MKLEDEMKNDASFNEKILEAKNYERTSGKPCYVVYSVPMQSYLTTSKMPLMGEWYDSDGIQHGI